MISYGTPLVDLKSLTREMNAALRPDRVNEWTFSPHFDRGLRHRPIDRNSSSSATTLHALRRLVRNDSLAHPPPHTVTIRPAPVLKTENIYSPPVIELKIAWTFS